MVGQSVRPLTDLEWAECNYVYDFLSWMPNRLLYLVVPAFFVVGLATPYLLSWAASEGIWSRVIATAAIFGLAYSAAYLTWLYYRFLTAVWLLWRHQLIKRPPVARHLRAVR